MSPIFTPRKTLGTLQPPLVTSVRALLQGMRSVAHWSWHSGRVGTFRSHPRFHIWKMCGTLPTLATNTILSIFSVFILFTQALRGNLLQRRLMEDVELRSGVCPVDAGGVANVWAGRMGDYEVAIKSYRCCSSSDYIMTYVASRYDMPGIRPVPRPSWLPSSGFGFSHGHTS